MCAWPKYYFPLPTTGTNQLPTRTSSPRTFPARSTLPRMWTDIGLNTVGVAERLVIRDIQIMVSRTGVGSGTQTFRTDANQSRNFLPSHKTQINILNRRCKWPLVGIVVGVICFDFNRTSSTNSRTQGYLLRNYFLDKSRLQAHKDGSRIVLEMSRLVFHEGWWSIFKIVSFVNQTTVLTRSTALSESVFSMQTPMRCDVHEPTWHRD